MRSSCLLVIIAAPLSALAYAESLAGLQNGVPIVAPPRPNNTGILPIPERTHPFRAPGPDDRRGPCPALNTLANHGYIPRNGIASFEQMVEAATHAFNMDYDLASMLSAMGILTRGNSFIDKLSIGLPSPLVPPLPGRIDGPVARGLATHGRFEGDVSITRQDAAIGDHKNFQANLFDQLLGFVAQFGNDSSVTGPRSIINIPVMQEFKFKRFQDSQAANKQLELHIGRFLLSYLDTANVLNFFANGTDGTASVPTITSFFRDERFPKNWHRRSSPGTGQKIFTDGFAILLGHPLSPGANNANGVYIPDSVDISDVCAFYSFLGGNNLPAVLVNTTGVLRSNVNFLLDALHTPFAPCPLVVPSGPSDV